MSAPSPFSPHQRTCVERHGTSISCHKGKLAAHSIISSAQGKQRRRNFKAEHKVATPVNWKHGEDAIIAGSATDEDVPSNETFVPPTLRRQNTGGLPEGRPPVFRNY